MSTRRTPTPRDSIRVARTSDLPELLKLIRAYYAFDGLRFRLRTVEPSLKRLLRTPSFGRVWMIEFDSRAIGYVLLTFNYDLEFGGNEGIVTDLFLRPRYRRRGLGRQALRIVDDYCRANGIGTVELQVEEHNKEALRFYERLGFTRLRRTVLSREVKPRRDLIGVQ